MIVLAGRQAQRSHHVFCQLHVLARFCSPVTGQNRADTLVAGFARSDRIVVRLERINSERLKERLERVRVSVRKGTAPAVGSFVEFKARLSPPLEPLRPGGYDFARDMYFQRIGASGFVLGRIRTAEAPRAPGLRLRYAAAMDGMRLALFAYLDKARQLHVPYRRRQDGMGDDFAFDAGGRKPGCDGSDADRRREREWPMAARNRRCYGRGEQQRCCPWRGLPLDGEIDDRPAAECDREPRHQPAWSDLDRHPFAHVLRRTACEIPEALRPGQCGPAPRRDPRPPYLGPPARSTLLGHRAAP